MSLIYYVSWARRAKSCQWKGKSKYTDVKRVSNVIGPHSAQLPDDSYNRWFIQPMLHTTGHELKLPAVFCCCGWFLFLFLLNNDLSHSIKCFLFVFLNICWLLYLTFCCVLNHVSQLPNISFLIYSNLSVTFNFYGSMVQALTENKCWINEQFN